MDCKNTQKAMQRYLNDELEIKELASFLEHIEACSKCKEELEIRLLVGPGIDILESGQPFDLKKEYDRRFDHSKEVVGLSGRISFGFTGMLICIAIFVILVFLGIILL